VLILDEPLSGLDATSPLVIKNLIKELGQQKKAIFYCSHVLEVVEKVCSHLLILRQGNVIAYGRSEDIQREIGQSSLEHTFMHLTAEADVEDTARQIAAVVSSK